MPLENQKKYRLVHFLEKNKINKSKILRKTLENLKIHLRGFNDIIKLIPSTM